MYSYHRECCGIRKILHASTNVCEDVKCVVKMKELFLCTCCSCQQSRKAKSIAHCLKTICAVTMSQIPHGYGENMLTVPVSQPRMNNWMICTNKLRSERCQTLRHNRTQSSAVQCEANKTTQHVRVSAVMCREGHSHAGGRIRHWSDGSEDPSDRPSRQPCFASRSLRPPLAAVRSTPQRKGTLWR